MTEKVIIPDPQDVEIASRPQVRKGDVEPDHFRIYRDNSAEGNGYISPMAHAGEGYRIHVTGLTHDERGYPAMTVEAQEQMMTRIKGKIRNNLDDIIETESYRMEDADIVIVSYGISVRTGLSAVDQARALGYKAGLLRLVTVWPFPENLIREIAERVRGFVTVEINLGQVHYEVERCAGGRAEAHLVGSAGGKIIHPDRVLECIQRNFR